MKSTKLSTILKLSIVISILSVSLSVSYYFVSALPKQENEKLRLKKVEMLIKQEKLLADKRKVWENKELLNACLTDATQSYNEEWDRSCAGLGRRKDCSLPSSIVDSVDKHYSNYRNDCFKKYPQK